MILIDFIHPGTGEITTGEPIRRNDDGSIEVKVRLQSGFEGEYAVPIDNIDEANQAKIPSDLPGMMIAQDSLKSMVKRMASIKGFDTEKKEDIDLF